MIKFRRRKLPCWIKTIPFDIVDYNDEPSILEFDNEEALIQFIHSALPFTKTSTLNVLEINERSCVIWGGPLGWIVD
jgi:hypothetical protein